VRNRVACTSDATWNSQGSTLIAGERSHPAANDGPTGTLTQTPFAYESLPQDVTAADGTYTFDFGPLSASFNWPTDPFGVGYYWPPDWLADVSPAGPPSIVTLRGQRFFQEELSVSGPTCSGLAIWIY
jgi:hypothetical protein